MFDEAQINSYNSITAPADLRQRVLTACENKVTVKQFPLRQTLSRVAPLVACLALLVSVFALNQKEPLALYVADTQLAEDSIILPPASEPVAIAEPMAYGIRTCDLAPEQYIVTLSANQKLEILSADGTATLDETGTITWAVYIPTKDMVYELYLSTGDDTYYVPLQYHVEDGSFSIHYEEQ